MMNPSLIALYSLPVAAIFVWYLRAHQRRERESMRAAEEALAQSMTEPPSLHPVIDPTLCIGCRSCVAACPEQGDDENKMVVGALEKIWLSALEMPINARIDTGVQTSSLNARNIESFERDGKSWVRFEITDPRTDELVPVERKVRRTIGFTRNGGSETKRRPVVRMGIVIGDIREKAEFTVVERAREGYQALIGRSILSDVMVVDVSRENIAPYILPDEPEDTTGASR